MRVAWSHTLHSVGYTWASWYSEGEKAALGVLCARPPRARVLAALCGLGTANTATRAGPVASHGARSSAAAHRGHAGVTSLGAVLATRCGVVELLRGVQATSAPWPVDRAVRTMTTIGALNHCVHLSDVPGPETFGCVSELISSLILTRA